MKTIEKAINTSFTIKKTDSFRETQHQLDKQQAYAIIAAIRSNRPLLVLGEPGVGKSQLARAAAHLLDREFIASVVQPNSDYEDLLWRFDHTARLSDAQLHNTDKVSIAKNYIAPGPFWYGLNWKSAEEQAKLCNNNYHPPSDIKRDNIEKNGIVLLIDEIDKADISLSNGLLEVLGNRSFFVPPLGDDINMQQDVLLVLTSNNTRQLPEALQRRCVVLNITLPQSDAELLKHLVTIGKAHYESMDDDVLKQAAEQIIEDRNRCKSSQKTGQAEYLDLLSALQQCGEETAVQLEWLEKLSHYFKKSSL